MNTAEIIERLKGSHVCGSMDFNEPVFFVGENGKKPRSLAGALRVCKNGQAVTYRKGGNKIGLVERVKNTWYY